MSESKNLLLNNPLDSLHILCVEDDDNDVFIFQFIINKIFPSAQITFIENGEEFINYILKQKKYENRLSLIAHHIVFLDINMPKMNGFDVLKEVKENKNIYSCLNEVPFVMLSTSKREQDMLKSLSLGAIDYLVKSFCYQEMTSCIINSLNSYNEKGYIKQYEI